MRTHCDACPSVLIIDDDLALLETYTVLLEEEFQVHTATTGEAGLECFQRTAIDLLLLDLDLPGMDGLEVLQRVKVLDAQVPVIISTAMGEIQRAAHAFKLGAADCLVKPFDAEATLPLLRRTLAWQEPLRGTLITPAETAVPRVLDVLVSQSAAMRQLATTLSRVADTTATVLLMGESGVGKALVARAIHQQSSRSAGPFLSVQCGSIPEESAASLFFGFEGGPSRGARTRHPGIFERVHGGTLLLDDVGSLPLSLQAMLLRVLQERTFERVGGSHPLRVDVRIIASAHQRLSDLVETRAFREDLFYCLHVVPVVVPPLRERQEDLPLLVRHFLAKYNQAFGRQVPGITRDALAVLGRYSWPGNVRELENLIARLVASSRSRVLEVWDLPAEIHATSHRLLHLPMVVAEVERHTLEGALRQAQGNRSEAARLVGMSRANFYRKLKRYGLLPLAREG